MKKYVQRIDEVTKLCDVVIGDDFDYYRNKGLEEKEVELGFDELYYLKGYAPKQPLDEVKVHKNEEINQIRDEKKLTEGASYNNDLFDIDDVSKMNITGLLVATSMASGDVKQVYRSKTNQNHIFNKKQLGELGIAIANKVEEIYQKSWELKEKVEKAKTIEEVEAVKWS